MPYPKVLVSLTSYPRRIPYAVHSVETLLHQTVPADEIHLNLVRSEFEGASPDLMDAIAQMESAGILVDWQDDNLKPHNKYFWTMREHPDDVVITVDDDIVYPATLVQSLLEGHFRHPDAVISNRTHVVISEGSERLAPYKEWIMEQTEVIDEPRFDLLATGVGGVLYPPRVFDEAVFDISAIKELCLLADDLWLLLHEERLGVPVVNTPAHPGLYYVPGSQEEGLYVENLDNGRNDVILARLVDRYPEIGSRIVAKARMRPELQPQADDSVVRSGLIGRIFNRLR